MKAYKVIRNIAPLILNLGTRYDFPLYIYSVYLTLLCTYPGIFSSLTLKIGLYQWAVNIIWKSKKVEAELVKM
jgi:hypothetical protein